MKTTSTIKALIIAFFICIPVVSFSQLAFGYRSHFGGMKPYKEIMQYYNDNRPWLDKELSESAYMHGFEIGIGGGGDKFGLTLARFYVEFGKTRAKGTDMYGDFERIVRTRVFGVEPVDVWWTPLNIKNLNIGFGVMPLGLGLFKIDAYLKDEGFERIPVLESGKYFFKNQHMYGNVHLDVVKYKEDVYSLHFQLFYSIGPTRNYNLLDANIELNPSTYSSFHRRTSMKINNFGMKLILAI